MRRREFVKGMTAIPVAGALVPAAAQANTGAADGAETSIQVAQASPTAG